MIGPAGFMAGPKDVAENHWVFERSSGYAGYRNTQTGEWIYESEYKKLESDSFDARDAQETSNGPQNRSNKFQTCCDEFIGSVEKSNQTRISR